MSKSKPKVKDMKYTKPKDNLSVKAYSGVDHRKRDMAGRKRSRGLGY